MLIKCVYVRQANHHNLSVVNGGIYVAKPIPCFNGSYYIKVDGNEYIVKTIGEALMIKSLGVIMAKFEIVRGWHELSKWSHPDWYNPHINHSMEVK